ncbi:WAS/WASL-interacting protein family member 3-like [Moschus berezovskii]|uniref:WAS/WASL-interacting protein family member 3-like n=1 Tax=Moschus berezovskii TaxID=68408 RepID=UPI0024442256|nr:WAS/WASL-interacting protein family member 3-like [Moschus berezovskii]
MGPAGPSLPGTVKSQRPELTQHVAEVQAPLDTLSSRGQRIPASLQAPPKQLRSRRQKRTESGRPSKPAGLETGATWRASSGGQRDLCAALGSAPSLRRTPSPTQTAVRTLGTLPLSFSPVSVFLEKRNSPAQLQLPGSARQAPAPALRVPRPTAQGSLPASSLTTALIHGPSRLTGPKPDASLPRAPLCVPGSQGACVSTDRVSAHWLQRGLPPTELHGPAGQSVPSTAPPAPLTPCPGVHLPHVAQLAERLPRAWQTLEQPVKNTHTSLSPGARPPKAPVSNEKRMLRGPRRPPPRAGDSLPCSCEVGCGAIPPATWGVLTATVISRSLPQREAA